MLTATVPLSLDIPLLPEGRHLAALYFGEARYGLQPHQLRAAVPGDHGLLLLIRDGHAFIAHDSIMGNVLLLAPCHEHNIQVGTYVHVDPAGVRYYTPSVTTPETEDRIADALASYRLMRQTADAPAVTAHAAAEPPAGNDFIETTTPPVSWAQPAQSAGLQLSPDDLDAIAQYSDGEPDGDAATVVEPSQDEPQAVDSLIAVALSEEHVLMLLSREHPDADPRTQLEAIRQGNADISVLQQRVSLDYTPSQSRFIGVLEATDKALLDHTLSTLGPAAGTPDSSQPRDRPEREAGDTSL